MGPCHAYMRFKPLTFLKSKGKHAVRSSYNTKPAPPHAGMTSYTTS